MRALIVALSLFAFTANAADLAGLWKAKLRFGPDARGPLFVERSGTTFTAEMMGRVVPMRVEEAELTFTLPNNQGTFRGKLEPAGHIHGHWLRPGAPSNGGVYASPVTLAPAGPNRWSGTVVPFEDTFTFYLFLTPREDGSFDAILRNPERDLGSQYGIERLTREGSAITLHGRRPLSGTVDDDGRVITLVVPNRGGSFTFTRDGSESDFYARGKGSSAWQYRPPASRDDGWTTSTPEAANISRSGIESLLKKIVTTPDESREAMLIDALLIARGGKLVVEEYFHGFHRDQLHDTRSAAKSLTAIVAGAVMQSGAPLSLSTRVYETMKWPAGDDPRKAAMTLEDLLTMSAGYFCDDTNEAAPGNEERMSDQTDEPDYYRYTLRVPLATPPAENAVYCSALPNLALGVTARATNESPLYAFDRLVAAPLKIRRYAWPLDPAGNPYGGGSVQLLPRDFLKLGQLMLSGGTWDGKRVLSREFAERASSRLYNLRNIHYGFLWWVEDVPYKDRTVKTYSARGAGGQSVTVVPELDLVVATFAGHYGSGKLAGNASTNLVPRMILPAVRERGDDANAPVIEREFVSPYGASKNGSRVSTAAAPPR